MTKIDQFESVFKAADKRLFEYADVELKSVLLVTDLAAQAADEFGARVRSFLSVLDRDQPTWRTLHRGEFTTVGELLAIVEEERPALVVAYRNLHEQAWRWPHGLGSYLDVLTQAGGFPVLVVPHPEGGRQEEFALADTRTVVAMTDHLAGDDRLVQQAVRFTEPGGVLHLTHVEDEATFERYLGVIGRIPAIDTETARRDILEQLLKEPAEYVESCRGALAAAGMDLTVEPHVTVGHHLREHQDLIANMQVGLLVMNTKEDDQLAMHGLAWPLAVELRSVPLLML